MAEKAKVFKVIRPGEDVCQVCGNAWGVEFVDGRLANPPVGIRIGVWANVCTECFTRFGAGLGLGRGQRFRFVKEDVDGNIWFEKIDG